LRALLLFKLHLGFAFAALAGIAWQVTSRTVSLRTKVDASIVGGLVARVGGTVYDGSVTRQLERMRQRLVENA